jgi:hypothetical protein
VSQIVLPYTLRCAIPFSCVPGVPATDGASTSCTGDTGPWLADGPSGLPLGRRKWSCASDVWPTDLAPWPVAPVLALSSPSAWPFSAWARRAKLEVSLWACRTKPERPTRISRQRR